MSMNRRTHDRRWNERPAWRRPVDIFVTAILLGTLALASVALILLAVTS